MAENSTPSAIRESDYETLLSALTETDRGRWFLDEYLRRQQKPDTQVVLDAINRLEKAMVRERTVPSIDRIRLDIADMQEAIERTKREIANIKHEADEGNRFSEASNELDAIVTKTEAATQEILAAAESIQEHGWTLREAGADEATCDEIDARATEIFMACSFQDLTGQRTQKIVQVLQYLESRINMMISIWGIDDLEAKDLEIRKDTRPDAHLLNGPQLEGRGVNQNAVDELFGTDVSADAAIDAEIHAADADAVADEPAPNALEGVTEDDIANAGFAGETAGADEIDALFAEAPTMATQDDIDAAFDLSDADVAASHAVDAPDAESATSSVLDDAVPATDEDEEADLPTAETEIDFEIVTGEADVFAVDALDAETIQMDTSELSPLAGLTDVSEEDLQEADVFETIGSDASDHEDERQWRDDPEAKSSSPGDESADPLDGLSDGEKQTLFS